MQDSLSAMKVALRVLTALTERRMPEQSDIEELQRRAQPLGPITRQVVSLDELACEVIRQAVKNRAAARQGERSG
jgi:hypothetical protein